MKTSAKQRIYAYTKPTVIFATILLSFFFQQPFAFAQEQLLSSKITDVTVYRDQAKVVREIQIPAAPGLQHIRVSGLPTHMNCESAHTESDAKTIVRSMQIVATKPGESDKLTAAQKQAKEAVAKVQSDLKSAQQNLSVIEQDMLTLEKLVDFSAKKARDKLDRASLDVQSVTALADFTMQRRRKLAEELFQQKNEIDAFGAELARLQKKPKSTDSVETTFDAVLAVQSPNGGSVRLTYKVHQVSWSPRYVIRGSNDKDAKYEIDLDAMIVQNSGESWENVSLSLATSTPDTRASGPVLTPLRIDAVDESKKTNRSTAGSGTQLTSRQINTQNVSQNVSQWLDARSVAQNVQLNTDAGLRQIDELVSTNEVQRNVATDASALMTDETYSIGDEVSLASHQNPQTVSILTKQLEGELHRVVTPLLSSFAFRSALLVNDSGQNLIAGPADVYLENQFVGRVQLPPTALGQKITVGFGTDRQVRTRRELLSRGESFKGGNRRTDLKYRLVISNYHETPIAIRLVDRMPISAKDDSINLTLSPEETKRLSADALYQRMQRPTGILRWDIEIPAKRFGSEAFDHEYAYSVEMDRTQTIVSNAMLKRTESDLRFQKTNMGGGFGGGGFGGGGGGF